MQPYIELTVSQRIAITAITEKIAILQNEQGAVLAEIGLASGTPCALDGNRLYVLPPPAIPATLDPVVPPDAPAP